MNRRMSLAWAGAAPLAGDTPLPESSAFQDYQGPYIDCLFDRGSVHLFVPNRWQRVLHLQMRERHLLRLPTRGDMRLLLTRLPLALILCQMLWPADWRDIRTGREIPTESYADQPYVVKTDDGAWLVCITTGSGKEGEPGQHVVTLRSTDQGRTWSKPVDVEPAQGVESSYAVMLKVASGRVYIFYNHNTDNVREVIADKPAYPDGLCRRVDSLGHFVLKYSDDHGHTWSARRYDLPMRDFAIDRRNAYAGKLKFFWNVGKPFTHHGAGYVPVHKVGGFGEGFFTSSEGALLRSDNILTERDPQKLRWQTLPEGDIGLRTPQGGGTIAEEQSFVVLSDGSIFCVYRSIDGHPVFTYSRDAGRTWDPPQYMRFSDGRLMKHPRAANFVWRCENGKYLYWFHNHGGRFIREHPQQRTIAYLDRNPVWIAGAIEVESPNGKVLQWSEPEILFYDDDPIIRMSYPDLVEEGGKFFFTETQKDVARVHGVDASLLNGLWGQFSDRPATLPRPLLSLPAPNQAMPSTAPAPALPLFSRRSGRADHGSEDLRAGFSVLLRTRLTSLEPGQILVDSRTAEGKGLVIRTGVAGAVEIVINDGRTENRWDSGPGQLERQTSQHVAVIVDGGPKIISFVVDGRFCDGGDDRQFGWGRFNPQLQSANGGKELRVGASVLAVAFYGVALRTSDVVAHRRSMLTQ